MQIGSDVFDVNGMYLGRAFLKFPDKATSEDRARFFEAMVKIERAPKVEMCPDTMQPKRKI